MMHARTARDNFSSMLAIGIGSLIFVEFNINIAMVLGIFPAAIFLLWWLVDGDDLHLLGLLIAIDRDSMRQQNRT